MVESNAVEELEEETTAQAPVEVGLPYRLVLDFSAIEMTGDQFVRFCARKWRPAVRTYGGKGIDRNAPCKP